MPTSLPQLDQAIGDGDHGINMKRGAEKILQELPEICDKPADEALKAMGMALVMSVGGASGPLFGSLLMEMGKSLGTQNAIVLVNGLGATPLSELYLLYDCVQAQLEKRDVRIARTLVGNYVTSLEMAGCSLTVSIVDDDLIKWWDAPVHTAALRWHC